MCDFNIGNFDISFLIRICDSVGVTEADVSRGQIWDVSILPYQWRDVTIKVIMFCVPVQKYGRFKISVQFVCKIWRFQLDLNDCIWLCDEIAPHLILHDDVEWFAFGL